MKHLLISPILAGALITSAFANSIHEAARSGDVSVVQTLLNTGIDVNKKNIQILESENKFHPIIEVPSLVLNDCCKKKMFSTWPASKRLKIFLPEKSLLRQVELFFLFLVQLCLIR